MSTRTRLQVLGCSFLGAALLSSTQPPANSSPAPSSVASASPELVQKDSEHKKVGKLMAECIEAYVKRDGQRDAQAELSEYLDKKWKKGAEGRSPLSLSDDLGAALWYATDYTKVKGIKKGRIEDLEIPVPFYGEDFVSTSSVWIPKKYSAKEKYPLVMIIPAQGERPEDTLNEHWAEAEVRDGAILVALGMPEKTENWGALGTQNKPEEAGGTGILLSTFKHCQQSFAVDFDRVFLAGHGAGVEAAMLIANSFPDRFCAIVGRSGDAAAIAPENMSNLPCFFAGGGKRATEYSEQAADGGYAECQVQADAKLPDIWAWMQETRRRSNPEQVVLRPGQPFPNKAYWVVVPPIAYGEDARLVAKADRASNTITIEAKGITSVEVFLNDSLVDLEKPVKVVCNGAVNEDVIPRSFAFMMTSIYTSRSDPGKLYTASRSYDLAPSEGEAEEDAAVGPR